MCNNNPAAVALLLAAGADVNLINGQPLHRAFLWCHVAIAEALLGALGPRSHPYWQRRGWPKAQALAERMQAARGRVPRLRCARGV